MTDANLVRVLQQQTTRRVGLVDYAVVSKGTPAIIERFGALRGEGCRFAIVDALSNDDLLELGAACADLALVTAGSGGAPRPPANLPDQSPPPGGGRGEAPPAVEGVRAAVAGRCSTG